jgi:hypothetical protein
MLPYIRRAKEGEYLAWMNAKWVVVSKKYNSRDLCESFGVAFRYWLWNLGVPPRIAFGWFNKYKSEDDE